MSDGAAFPVSQEALGRLRDACSALIESGVCGAGMDALARALRPYAALLEEFRGPHENRIMFGCVSRPVEKQRAQAGVVLARELLCVPKVERTLVTTDTDAMVTLGENEVLNLAIAAAYYWDRVEMDRGMSSRLDELSREIHAIRASFVQGVEVKMPNVRVVDQYGGDVRIEGVRGSGEDLVLVIRVEED